MRDDCGRRGSPRRLRTVLRPRRRSPVTAPDRGRRCWRGTSIPGRDPKLAAGVPPGSQQPPTTTVGAHRPHWMRVVAHARSRRPTSPSTRGGAQGVVAGPCQDRELDPVGTSATQPGCCAPRRRSGGDHVVDEQHLGSRQRQTRPVAVIRGARRGVEQPTDREREATPHGFGEDLRMIDPACPYPSAGCGHPRDHICLTAFSGDPVAQAASERRPCSRGPGQLRGRDRCGDRPPVVVESDGRGDRGVSRPAGVCAAMRCGAARAPRRQLPHQCATVVAERGIGSHTTRQAA